MKPQRYDPFKYILKFLNITNIPFVLILVFYLYFISSYLSFYPLWDGYYYFSILKFAISNVKSLSDFIGMFNLNAHPSMGYATYVSLGQLLSFNNQFVLHIQNILLNLLAAYAFFKILIYFIGINNKLEAYFISSIFLFHPLNNATLLNFNLDYPTLIFTTTLFYSYIYKKDKLVIFSGLMLVFSKETGIILYLSFLTALYIPIITNWISGTRLKPARISFYFIFPILILCAYFFLRFALHQSLLFSAGYGSSINIIKELFTFDLKITLARFLQIFVLNFNWIASIFAALYTISLFKLNKFIHFDSDEKLTNFVVIIFVFAIYLYMSIFLFKEGGARPRYIVVSIFFLILFFSKALIELFSNKKLRAAIICTYLLFTISQNFASIDPISNTLFGTYNFGSHKIVNTAAIINPPYGRGPRELMSYNLQFTIIDKLVLELYKTIKVDESTYVITERMDHPSIHPQFRNKNIQPNVIILDELAHQVNNLNPSAKIYYVHIPQIHNSSIGLNIIMAHFKVIKQYKVEIDGYQLNAYSLQKL